MPSLTYLAPVIGFGLFGPATQAIAKIDPIIAKHKLIDPDYCTNFQEANLSKYNATLLRCPLFFGYTTDMDNVITQAIADQRRIVVFDMEPMNGLLSTPKVEYQGSIGGIPASAHYINLAATAAHTKGLKFGITPSANIYSNINKHLLGVNWKAIDYWFMQGSSEAGQAAQVIQRAVEFGGPAKAANPGMIVTCAINEGSTMPFMTTPEVVKIWNGVKGHIDGVEFHRYTDPLEIDSILTALQRN